MNPAALRGHAPDKRVAVNARGDAARAVVEQHRGSIPNAHRPHPLVVQNRGDGAGRRERDGPCTEVDHGGTECAEGLDAVARGKAELGLVSREQHARVDLGHDVGRPRGPVGNRHGVLVDRELHAHDAADVLQARRKLQAQSLPLAVVEPQHLVGEVDLGDSAGHRHGRERKLGALGNRRDRRSGTQPTARRFEHGTHDACGDLRAHGKPPEVGHEVSEGRVVVVDRVLPEGAREGLLRDENAVTEFGDAPLSVLQFEAERRQRLGGSGVSGRVAPHRVHRSDDGHGVGEHVVARARRRTLAAAHESARVGVPDVGDVVDQVRTGDAVVVLGCGARREEARENLLLRGTV